MSVNVVMLGNAELLMRQAVAFLSSRRVPPEAVMASLDWAAKGTVYARIEGGGCGGGCWDAENVEE